MFFCKASSMQHAGSTYDVVVEALSIGEEVSAVRRDGMVPLTTVRLAWNEVANDRIVFTGEAENTC